MSYRFSPFVDANFAKRYYLDKKKKDGKTYFVFGGTTDHARR